MSLCLPFLLFFSLFALSACLSALVRSLLLSFPPSLLLSLSSICSRVFVARFLSQGHSFSRQMLAVVVDVVARVRNGCPSVTRLQPVSLASDQHQLAAAAASRYRLPRSAGVSQAKQSPVKQSRSCVRRGTSAGIRVRTLALPIPSPSFSCETSWQGFSLTSLPPDLHRESRCSFFP